MGKRERRKERKKEREKEGKRVRREERKKEREKKEREEEGKRESRKGRRKEKEKRRRERKKEREKEGKRERRKERKKEREKEGKRERRKERKKVGEILVQGRNETPTLELPFVVKPCCEGNSQGISLVMKSDDIDAAVQKGFTFDDELVVERYVPLGRELRVSSIEQDDGSIRILPAIEFFVNPDRKIRLPSDKLVTNEDGNATGYAK